MRSAEEEIFIRASPYFRVTVTKEWNAENIFDLMGSQLAREILVLSSSQPMSAKELATRCETSLPTIYRRVNALQEYDLLSESVEYDTEGNHYKTYETTLQRICFEIESGSCDVTLSLNHNLVGQFEKFWSELDDANKDETEP